MERMRRDCDQIVEEVIRHVQPRQAVHRALEGFRRPAGRLILVSVGKAGWSMAQAAAECVGELVDKGLVITKYGHSRGPIRDWTICEAGHPVPDEAGFQATELALDITAGLGEEDAVILLLSGGGSALFERPLVEGGELQDITRQLLSCGADIVEMNMIRKRLSGVKGGRFGAHCAPARVFTVVLSDIVGDPLDMIASGPACPDSSSCEEALAVVKKYGLKLSERARSLLSLETPEELGHVETRITGSVRELCGAAAEACGKLGYEPVILTDSLTCEAREAGAFLAAIARCHSRDGRDLAFIAGGETVVRLRGKGLGGRNQELALAAAQGIAGLEGAAVFSLGSDGTDGPTDAAGGFVTGDTQEALARHGIRIFDVLEDNDSYHALKRCGGLIVTGATGTNVNDVAVVLLRGGE